MSRRKRAHHWAMRAATRHYVISRALIGAALVLIAWQEVRAEIRIEIGPTFLSSDFARGGAFILSERFDRYEWHLGYVSEQEVDTCPRPDCHFDLRENLYVGGQRIFEWRRLRFGIGADYFQNTNRALGCRFNAGLMVGWRFSDRLSLRVRHNSSAGSCTPNLGQDFLGLAVTF